MSSCHWERAKALRRVEVARTKVLDAIIADAPEEEVNRLQDEWLKASEALMNLPDCSE